MSEYRCVHGHDKCAEMYPGPECPLCEKRQKQRNAIGLRRVLLALARKKSEERTSAHNGGLGE